ncbi:hypothetical protein [Parachlamydia sp. AcF125]|uniref:hypothetical protein n=1 Tax=Parachlamydia sp. AcF125 TaxID=2795736 RepID=UPI001BC9E6C8|nr:hypothetical protein [Parachlamydia sp. AcF125]MBS4167952.1 hypothetical protein [Parachlamydia sp. AcF125]
MPIVRTTSRLVTNHENWQLEYRNKSRVISKTNASISFVRECVISAIAYPIFLVGSLIFLPETLLARYRASTRQARTMAILQDKALLESYKNKKLEKHKNRIVALEKSALPLLATRSLLTLKPLSYSKKWSGDKKRDYWNKFLETDFYQEFLSTKNFNAFLLERLEKIRKKFSVLDKQNAVLPDDKSDSALQEILLLKAIKNKFKLTQAQNHLKVTFLRILPFGSMLYAPIKAWSFYERKKELLPQLPLFNKYADLVEAHNQLIERHEYLVPLLTEPFKPQTQRAGG